MQILSSENFKRDYKNLTKEERKLFHKKISQMRENPRHPSLRTKKIQGKKGIFEASITMDIRITWQYVENGIYIRSIVEHDSTLKIT